MLPICHWRSRVIQFSQTSSSSFTRLSQQKSTLYYKRTLWRLFTDVLSKWAKKCCFLEFSARYQSRITLIIRAYSNFTAQGSAIRDRKSVYRWNLAMYFVICCYHNGRFVRVTIQATALNGPVLRDQAYSGRQITQRKNILSPFTFTPRPEDCIECLRRPSARCGNLLVQNRV